MSNFAGEQVSGSWTDKIMAMKSEEDESQRVDDDDDNDWVNDKKKLSSGICFTKNMRPKGDVKRFL